MPPQISIDDDNEGFSIPQMPSTAPQSQPAPPIAAASEDQFPATMSDSLALLKQLDDEIRRTPDIPGSAYRRLKQRHEKLIVHIHRIQQGEQPSETSHLDHAANQRDWARASARLELLKALSDAGDADAAKQLIEIRASTFTAKAPATRATNSNGKSFHARIVNTPAVKSALNIARKAQSEFAARHAALDEQINYSGHAKSCEAALSLPCSEREVSALRQRLAKLIAPGAEASRISALRSIATAFQPFRESLSALIEAARTQAADLESEIEVAETAMFSGFGLSRQQTSLSGHVAAIAATLDGFESSLSARERSPQTLTPAVADDILNWFTL